MSKVLVSVHGCGGSSGEAIYPQVAFVVDDLEVARQRMAEIEELIEREGNDFASDDLLVMAVVLDEPDISLDEIKKALEFYF